MMSNDWLSPISTRLNPGSSNQGDFEPILEKISQPALIVSRKSGNILQVNQAACAYFRRSLEDLRNIHFDDLIEEQQNLSGSTYKQTKKFTFKKLKFEQDRPEQVDHLCFFSIGKHESLVLIQDPERNSKDLVSREKILFTNFIDLLESLFDSNVASMFSTTLQWVKNQTKADNVTLYMADESKPVFTIKGSVGESFGIPEELPWHEIPNIQSAYFWEPENRTSPVSTITKSLSGNKISSMVSLPVGEPGAIIGILVMIFKDFSPPDHIKELGTLAAILIRDKIIFQSKSTELEERNYHLLERIQTLEIVDNFIQEGILVTTSDLYISRLNPSIVHILGYSKDEILGQHIDDILIGYETIHPSLDQAKAKLSYQKITDHILFRRNGEQFLANLHILPVTLKDHIESFVIVIEDLSEKERIRIQTEQLEQRAYMGEVTAVFAHEVLNPVNNISTGLQLLSRSFPPDDPTQVEITRLLQDSDRLVDLMRSVLITSKPSDYSMKPVDIGFLLKRLVDRRMMRIQNANIRADLQIHPKTPYILGDLHALEQVFNNILNNAIQAMGETGGELVIKAQPIENQQDLSDPEEQKFIEISIADTGPGIPAEIQEKVFQPFYTTKPAGSGLGLSIVKRIVTLHKGKIRFESFPGGTIFYITLPSIKSQDIRIFN